jgi:hypothetical protein
MAFFGDVALIVGPFFIASIIVLSLVFKRDEFAA